MTAGLTLPRLLSRTAQAAPDGVALWHKRRGIWHARSWADYLHDVRACAAALHADGFARGDRLLLLGEASPEWLIAELAAQWLGGVTVTPYPDAGPAELATCLLQAPATYAVVDGGSLAAPHAVPRVVGMRDIAEMVARGPALLDDASTVAALRTSLEATEASAAATIVFTGGGTNRAVSLSHATLAKQAVALADALGMKRAHALCQAPFAHVAERVLGPVLHLVRGGTLFFPERIDTVATDLTEATPRCLSALPWQWDRLRRDIAPRLRATRGPFGKLAHAALRRRLGLHRSRWRLCHGGSLAPETEAFFRTIGLPVTRGYGIAETAGWSLLLAANNAPTALPGLGWRIVEDELHLSWQHQWLRTGDGATSQPCFGIVGRLSAGPQRETVEQALQASRFVQRAALVGQDRCAAMLVVLDPVAIGAWARDQGLAYTTPRSLAVLPQVETLIGAEVARLTPAWRGVPLRILADPPEREDGGLTPRFTLDRAVLARAWTEPNPVMVAE